MIRRFRHKEVERFFLSGDTRGINAQHAARLRRLPTTLNRSVGPAGMNLPGYRLHQLKGQRARQWAVSLSGNWRLVFAFDGDDATNVDLGTTTEPPEGGFEKWRCTIRRIPEKSSGRNASNRSG
jgi:proteic killer suppression protein